MKSIRISKFGPPSVLELDDVPALSPAAGQVLVRIHAAGVNPIEAYVRAGTYPRLPDLPYTPGSDGAGVIETSTPGSPPPGTRVFISGSITGTYAEQALCTPVDVHPLPDHITFEQGAALGIPYATAFWALFKRGKGQAGETLLIHGATGGVGLAALQLARGAGLRILGTAGTSEGMELVKTQGAEAVFNHHDPHYLDSIKAATDGRGVDLILEMLANQNLGHDLALLAQFGRVVVIGSRGPVQIDPRDMMMREADIRGMTLFSATPVDRAEIYGRIGESLESRKLDPVIGAKLPLAQAAQAHEQILSSSARGKMVLTM